MLRNTLSLPLVITHKIILLQFILSLIPFLLPYFRAYIHFMLTFTTGFSFSLSPFLSSSCSWGLFCLLYFLWYLHWARLPRQCSDQPETLVAYMAFIMSCLYKRMGLRRDGNRNQEEQWCGLFLTPIHCSTITSFSSSAPCSYPLWGYYYLWVIYNSLLIFSSRIRMTFFNKIFVVFIISIANISLMDMLYSPVEECYTSINNCDIKSGRCPIPNFWKSPSTPCHQLPRCPWKSFPFHSHVVC